MAYKGPTAATLKKEMTANKVFGAPAKSMPKKAMTKRKKTMISNAATKAFGGMK